jgi:hypothetical protein
MLYIVAVHNVISPLGLQQLRWADLTRSAVESNDVIANTMLYLTAGLNLLLESHTHFVPV